MRRCLFSVEFVHFDMAHFKYLFYIGVERYEYISMSTSLVSMSMVARGNAGIGGSVALRGMRGPLPSAIPAPAPPSTSAVQEPTIRSQFPETWIWTDTTCG